MPQSIQVCSVDGCPTAVGPKSARCMCNKHYLRWRAHGTTDLHSRPSIRLGNCSDSGCAAAIFARGMCTQHYNIWHYQTMPAGRERPNKGCCQVVGCPAGVKARGWCRRHYTNWQQMGDPLGLPPKACVICERPFKAYGKSIYCGSAECTYTALRNRANRASNERRARLLAQTVEEFDPREVFDRDGWICGICCRPIDPLLKFPDRHSVSLDHVIPLSLDGEHSRANTQAAHLRCNISKHNRI